MICEERHVSSVFYAYHASLPQFSECKVVKAFEEEMCVKLIRKKEKIVFSLIVQK